MKREHFSDDEARAILARASERQEAAERARLGTGAGVTLAELKQIADEVGIEASHVQAAAGELVLRDETSPTEVKFGLPMELSEVRMLPGAVSDRQWERMVTVFREAFGRTGLTNQFGDVREWVSGNESNDGMPLKVRLEPGEDGVLLEMRQSTRGIVVIGTALAGSFGSIGAVFAVLAAAGNFDPAFWTLPGLLAGIGIVSGLGTWLNGRAFVKKRRALMESVADKVELIGRPHDG